MSSVFDDVLNGFKKDEKAEDIIPVINNEDLLRILVAWPKIIISREKTKEELPAGVNERWRWLWSNITWCEKELQEITGIPDVKFKRLFNQVRGNRLVYPDGSISSHASKYLSNLSHTATARLKTELLFALEKMQKGGK